MYKNRGTDGALNISGKKITMLRKAKNPKLSQNGLAQKIQLAGVDLGKNAIQRIEAGKRFVTDIELKAIAAVLETSADELLKD